MPCVVPAVIRCTRKLAGARQSSAPRACGQPALNLYDQTLRPSDLFGPKGGIGQNLDDIHPRRRVTDMANAQLASTLVAPPRDNESHARQIGDEDGPLVAGKFTAETKRHRAASGSVKCCSPSHTRRARAP